jgi:shikimate kinase
MASGKTTFGRAAAERLGWDFVDLDQVITECYGTPAEIFAAHGETAFRDLETRTLGEVLLRERNTVLALGGGTILRDENLQLLKKHTRIIWLDTDFAIILSEIGNADRPVVRERSIAQIRALYDERRPRYAAAADIIFPINSTDYDQVIADLTATIPTL